MNFKKRKESFSASPPGDGMDVPPPPKNVSETKAWKSSQAGVNRLWNNYRQRIVEEFSAMSRAQQESNIQRLCSIFTLGVTALLLLLFYGVLHPTVRVFLVPGAIAVAWWAGKNIVTGVVLSRLESILNRD